MKAQTLENWKELICSEIENESKTAILNVPYSRNPRFTGREDKLKQIHELFFWTTQLLYLNLLRCADLEALEKHKLQLNMPIVINLNMNLYSG